MHVTDIIQQFNPWLKGASVNWGKDLSADLNVAFVGASARSAFKFSLLFYIHSLPLPLNFGSNQGEMKCILHSLLQIISLYLLFEIIN